MEIPKSGWNEEPESNFTRILVQNKYSYNEIIQSPGCCSEYLNRMNFTVFPAKYLFLVNNYSKTSSFLLFRVKYNYDSSKNLEQLCRSKEPRELQVSLFNFCLILALDTIAQSYKILYLT